MRPKLRLRGAGRRAVIIGEIEMGDAEIEGVQNEIARGRLRIDVAEILPEPERDARQQHAASAAAPIHHFVVAGAMRDRA